MNDFKRSYRNFVRHRPYSFLNLVGLSLGLSITFIVLLYINEEIGYDTHHENYKNTYRLIAKENARQELSSATHPLIPRLLEEQIPEIISSASYRSTRFTIGDILAREGLFYADPSVTDIFSFQFSKGNLKKFKEDVFAIIISESFAKTYFNGTSVVGQTIELGTEEDRATYTVSAVFEDFPKKSTFRPSLILQNYSSKRYRDRMKPEQLGYQGYQSYLKIDEKASISQVVKTMNRIYKSMPNSFNHSYTLQPLEKVHLYSEGIYGPLNGGSVKKVMIYGVIGTVILLISLMNYLLLYTSISRQRLKEIAIRKINGLKEYGLLKMFLFESLLVSLVCGIIAFLLMLYSIPIFNEFTNSNLEFKLTRDYRFLVYAIFLILIISSISGLYFHNFIKRHNSIDVLNRNRLIKTRSFFFGGSSVLVQLTIVCVMLTFTIGYYMQLDFMLNSGKGFNSDNLLVLNTRNWDASVFKDEALKYPYIKNVSKGNVLPLFGSSQIYDISLLDKPSIITPMELMRVDYDYFDLYDIEFLQGRSFSKDHASDITGRSLIINESALKMLNIKNPIGVETNEGLIVGVVDDFKFESFHKTLRPLFFRMPETTEYPEFNKTLRNNGYLMIRYSVGEKEKTIETVLALLEDQQINVISDYSELSNPRDSEQTYVLFDRDFYTTHTNRIYGNEKTLQKVVICLTLISIFITIFGLIGMSLYKVGQKTKEIAIRKVNGATTKQILVWLNKGFTKWILVALIFATPVSYFSLNRWLEGFAYHISLQVWYFLGVGLVTLFVVMLSVGSQAIKAANKNPIEALKE